MKEETIIYNPDDPDDPAEYVPGTPVRNGTAYFQLREDYFTFCEGDLCAFTVLSYFESRYRMIRNRINKKKFLAKQNHQFYKPSPDAFHLTISQSEIINGVFGFYKTPKYIGKAVDFLLEKKALIKIADHDSQKCTPAIYEFNQPLMYEWAMNYRGRYFKEEEDFAVKGCVKKFTDPPKKLHRPPEKIHTINNNKERHKHKDSSFIRKDFIKEGGTDHPSCREEDKNSEQSLFPSQDVEDLFNHWNMLGKPLSIHRADPTKKTFQRSILALQKALKSHSVDYIADTMDTYIKLLNYADRKFDDHTPGAVISLPEFFKFSENTESRMLTSRPLITVENWFTTCQKPWDELTLEFGKFDKDENPNVTAALIKSYKTEVENREFSVTETNIFIKAARLVVQLHCENNKKFDWKLHSHEKERPDWFAHHLIKAVVEDAQDKSFIAPSWLLSERTRKVRLRKHFIKCGLLWQFEDVAKPVNIETPKPIEPAKRVRGEIGRLTDEPTRKPAPMIKTGPAPVNDGPTRRPVAIPKSDKPIDPNAGRVRRHINSMGSRCKAKSWESMSWEERLADLALRR